MFGLVLDAVTMDEALSRIQDFIDHGGVHQHVAVNVDKVVKASRDPELRRTIKDADLVTADGQPIVWASRLLGKPLPERVTGIDLMTRLFGVAEARGYSVFLLGARSWVLERVVRRLRLEHPALRIAGTQHGYFDASEERTIVRQIAARGPDIVFVAMGSPAKERFLSRWKNDLGAKFVMGVGGSFDVYGGVVQRAPYWMQRVGCEWLYRLLQEPKRMWRRYLTEDARFLSILLREVLRMATKR